MSYHIEQYKFISKNKETWSQPQREHFIDSVIETGCRSGLFCYSSIVNRCDYVVGFDQDQQCINQCNYAFEKLKVPSYKYNFLTAQAEFFDYSKFDVVLCLGLLYNISDVTKKKVLQKIKTVPISLIEFWCIEDNDPNPHTTIYNQIQYMPNQVQAELFLKEAGLIFEEITPSSFQGYGHDNRYYLCQPLIATEGIEPPTTR